ncbi:MAG: hypothetical protein LBT77_00840 [Mycoplasmataceae bacterium]|jgi:phosphotransferase system IIB component|nr:hypothetical protein [Mycoplasmataceae bacterium]
MNKFFKYILYVLSLGILPLYIKHKAKHQIDVKRQEFIVSKEINFDLNLLVNLFGGLNNIANVSSTMSTVAITLKNEIDIEIKYLKKFGIRSYFKKSNQYILVFGDNAQVIANQIKLKLGN